MSLQKTNNSPAFYLLLLIVLVFLCFLNGLDHQFTNWDDRAYILNNPLLQKSTPLGSIFTSFWMGNYHPLTLLSYKFNFLISPNDPKVYLLTNCLFHLLNVFLVFFIANYFFEQNVKAFAVALLFAIHPVQMESVMWLSARKDLLYVMFYLISFGSWIIYHERRSKRFYFIALFCFVFALLSKAMAVSLPLVLMGYHWLKQKQFDINSLGKMLPFFILSAIFGIIAYKAQASQTGALAPTVDLLTRVVLVFSSVGRYFLHVVFPFGLSALYPYPFKLTLYYWFFALLTLGSIVLFCANLWKMKKFYVFAILFFIFNLVFVLQLFPVGFAVMADRYSYLASIGLFVVGVDLLFSTAKHTYSKVFWIIAFVLVFVSFKRIAVWKNAETLWLDVLSKYPESSIALINHGSVLFESGRIQEAEQEFIKAYSVDSLDAKLNYDIGLIRMQQQRFDEADLYCTKSILIDPLNIDAYYNRGLIRIYLRQYAAALSDFKFVLKQNPRAADAIGNCGLIYYNVGKKDSACLFWQDAQKWGWANGNAYISRFCNK